MVPEHGASIGQESSKNLVNQSQSIVKQNQSKRKVTCDTQSKKHTFLSFSLVIVLGVVIGGIMK